MSTYGATQSWVACQKRRRRYWWHDLVLLYGLCCMPEVLRSSVDQEETLTVKQRLFQTTQPFSSKYCTILLSCIIPKWLKIAKGMLILISKLDNFSRSYARMQTGTLFWNSPEPFTAHSNISNIVVILDIDIINNGTLDVPAITVSLTRSDTNHSSHSPGQTSSPGQGRPWRPCWGRASCRVKPTRQPSCWHCHSTTRVTDRCRLDIMAALMLRDHTCNIGWRFGLVVTRWLRST